MERRHQIATGGLNSGPGSAGSHHQLAINKFNASKFIQAIQIDQEIGKLQSFVHPNADIGGTGNDQRPRIVGQIFERPHHRFGATDRAALTIAQHQFVAFVFGKIRQQRGRGVEIREALLLFATSG